MSVGGTWPQSFRSTGAQGTMLRSIGSSLVLLFLSITCRARDLSRVHHGSIHEPKGTTSHQLEQANRKLRGRRRRKPNERAGSDASFGETFYYSFIQRKNAMIEQPTKNRKEITEKLIQTRKTNSKILEQRELKRGANSTKDTTGEEEIYVNSTQLKSSSCRNLRDPNVENNQEDAVNDIVEQERRELKFDFVVAGFPKCGTTTLLKAFAAHEETDMPLSEKCAIASPGLSDAIVRKKINETLQELSKDSTVKRAFKCPTALYNFKSLVRMEQYSSGTKFLVGLRHPITMLQSFYNYRVTEIHERNLDEAIPSLEDVWRSREPWKGVSIESTRFDLFLMQMAKTDVAFHEMKALTSPYYDLAIKPTNSEVFLYTVDQLDDSNDTRSKLFRSKMQEFLGLSKPIPPFGHENENHAVGSSGYPETINICDAKWAVLRKQLLDQGIKSKAWILYQFIESPDVTVANRDHFIATVESWGEDPCRCLDDVE